MIKHLNLMFFYIIKDESADHDLPSGPRILKSAAFIPFIDENVEGPFNSIKELKLNSEIYKLLLQNNPKRAIKIFEEKYIHEFAEIVFYPENRNPNYADQIYSIMEHSKNGKVASKNVSGIHLYEDKKHRILEIINPKNDLGVWEAKIEVLNRNNKWIPKEKPTTFFPESWTLQQLIVECEKAYNEKVKLSECVYMGYTKSGIPVKFIFDSNFDLKTIYPIYE
jgi:hypothetical protein